MTGDRPRRREAASCHLRIHSKAASNGEPAALPCRLERCVAMTQKIYILKAVRTGEEINPGPDFKNLAPNFSPGSLVNRAYRCRIV
jgi:hypothetical protein